MVRIPIVLVPVAAVLGAGSASCVVPAARYEEARSALHVESDAHRQTHVRMYALQVELEAARTDLADQQRKVAERDALLAQHERLLAQSELELANATSDREDAEGRVTQLRSELERVGEHLRSFATHRKELEASLASAEDRAQRLADLERDAARRALAMRDLALALHDPIRNGVVTIALDQGRPVLRLPSEGILSSDGETLREGVVAVLSAVARIAAEMDPGQVELTESGVDSALADESMARLDRVARALGDGGLAAGKVIVSVPTATSETAPGTGPAFVEIALATPSG